MTARTRDASETRVFRLAKRWRDIAEVGFEGELQNHNGWAEHIRRLAAEPEIRERESKD